MKKLLILGAVAIAIVAAALIMPKPSMPQTQEVYRLKLKCRKFSRAYKAYRGHYLRSKSECRKLKSRTKRLESELAPIKLQARKIDKVLSHHALSGHGIDFAKAAKLNGLQNPFLSASIAGVESTFGDACFRSHNAWGWYAGGNMSDWTTAIYKHAAYLKRRWHNPRSSWKMAGYCIPSDPWRSNVAKIESRIRSAN